MNRGWYLALVVAAMGLMGSGGHGTKRDVLPRTTDDPLAVAALKPLTSHCQVDEDGRVTGVIFDRKAPLRTDDLRHLQGLAALHALTLNDQASDAGLEHLRKLQTIETLSLGHNISDDGLRHLMPLTGLKALTCDCPKVTDKGLERLKGLHQVTHLSLRGTSVTDAGIAHLKGMAELKFLYLDKTLITDAGLEHLKGFRRLFSLKVENTHVTAEGARKLQQTLHLVQITGTDFQPDRPKPTDRLAWRHERTRNADDPSAVAAIKPVALSLKMDNTGCVDYISFHDTVTDNDLQHLPRLAGPSNLFIPTKSAVTDAGLEPIGKLKTLTSLSLWGIPITGEGLKHVRPLCHLSYVSLPDTQVDDAALEHLAGLKRIFSLALNGTRVTDAGLKHLQELPKLQFLRLNRTAVTDAGLETLAKFPKLSEVRLIGTPVTPQAVERMKTVRPQLFILLEQPPGDKTSQ